MLAASRFGMTSRLASPAQARVGKSRSRIASWTAPRRHASRLRPPDRRPRTISASAAHLDGGWLVELPKLECDSSATFGVDAEARTSSAASNGHLGDLVGVVGSLT